MKRPANFMLLITALLVLPAHAEDQTFEYAQLPRGIQRQFEREAANYLRIGEHLWSIELWLRQARMSTQSTARHEPFRQPDAPLFYDPVRNRRAVSLRAILGENDSHVIVVGRVVQHYAKPRGTMVNVSGRMVFIADPPEDAPTQPKASLMLIAKRDGIMDYRLNGKPARATRMVAVTDGPVRLVKPAELAQYFHQHQLKRFDRWQFRKVWDEQPKARRVYQQTEKQGVTTGSTSTRTGVGMGRAQPTEVIVDRGKYHWEFIRGGKRVMLPKTIK